MLVLDVCGSPARCSFRDEVEQEPIHDIKEVQSFKQQLGLLTGPEFQRGRAFVCDLRLGLGFKG